MHPPRHLINIFFLLSAKLHGAKSVDTATVSITSLAQYSVEPACVQSCMYYNSFGVADYLLFALGCTRFVRSLVPFVAFTNHKLVQFTTSVTARRFKTSVQVPL
jgi:hypothetical protein